MRQTRKNPFLLLLALALTVFAPVEVERVQGGGDDGPAPAINCVHALFPARELEFIHPIQALLGDEDLETVPLAPGTGAMAPHPGQIVLLPVARAGKLVETAYQACRTPVPGLPGVVLPVALLPHPPHSAALPPAQVAGRAREIRGPPLPPVFLLTPSLRAPPLA